MECAYCGRAIGADDAYIVARSYEHVHADLHGSGSGATCWQTYCVRLAARVLSGRTAVHRAAAPAAVADPAAADPAAADRTE